MTYTVDFVSKVPDPTVLERTLHGYLAPMLEMLAARGGPVLRTDDVLGGLWDDIDAYLPPRGRLVLAHDDDTDALIGCGFLRQIGPKAGEMKRLHVAPAARGTGLGRRLIEMRMQAARDMGWTQLFADTVQGNRPMLSLYARLGFYEVPRYPGNANTIEMEPYLTFLRHDLEPAAPERPA